MPVAERLAERLAQEEPLLRQAFPKATIDTEALVVILPRPSPARRLVPRPHRRAVRHPAQLPRRTARNNVCARPDLTLVGGATPGNSQGIQQHAGRSSLLFSYHIDPNDWRPHADAAKGSNLANYLTGALSRFQEAS